MSTFNNFIICSFLCSRQQSESSVGFFPNSEEQPDERYSQISDVKYLDLPSNSNGHQLQQQLTTDNRKQLNFGDPPSGPSQFYSSAPFPQQTSIFIRKRPTYNPYPTSTELSNPFYHNYANQYQYPQAAVSSLGATYPDLYPQQQPTRYPTPIQTANPYIQQSSYLSPNYYTNNYANQFRYDRPSSSIYGAHSHPQQTSGLSGILNNFRDTNGPFGRISSLGGQFNKALDDITTHDDLQCVPKVLCQMVQGTRSNRPGSIMNIPGFSM